MARVAKAMVEASLTVRVCAIIGSSVFFLAALGAGAALQFGLDYAFKLGWKPKDEKEQAEAERLKRWNASPTRLFVVIAICNMLIAAAASAVYFTTMTDIQAMFFRQVLVDTTAVPLHNIWLFFNIGGIVFYTYGIAALVRMHGAGVTLIEKVGLWTGLWLFVLSNVQDDVKAWPISLSAAVLGLAAMPAFAWFNRMPHLQFNIATYAAFIPVALDVLTTAATVFFTYNVTNTFNELAFYILVSTRLLCLGLFTGIGAYASIATNIPLELKDDGESKLWTAVRTADGKTTLTKRKPSDMGVVV